MKRFALVICMALVIVLTGCGYSEDDLKEAQENGYNIGYSAGLEEGREKGYEEGYDEGYVDGYDHGYASGYDTLKPISMPSSGTVLSGQEYYDESEITVKASFGDSYVVSLKDMSGKECISFFVRSGETVTIGVPSEYLYVYFASGDTWYGYGEGLMFGENTVYSKDDDALDFTQYTWEYTLYQVANGNFVETPSNQDEFFG